MKSNFCMENYIFLIFFLEKPLFLITCKNSRRVIKNVAETTNYLLKGTEAANTKYREKNSAKNYLKEKN